MLGHGPVPSGDRLLLSDDQLLPEDLDDEPPAEPKPQFVSSPTTPAWL